MPPTAHTMKKPHFHKHFPPPHMTVHRLSHESSQHITAIALFQSIYLSNSIKRQLCCMSTPSVGRKCLIQHNLAYSSRSRDTAAQPVRNTLHLQTVSLSYVFDWSVPLSASPKTCTVSCRAEKDSVNIQKEQAEPMTT